MSTNVSASPRELELSVVVIRADGSREDHGVVAYWHRNPLRRWAFALRNANRKAA